jgi:hypothetical protein
MLNKLTIIHVFRFDCFRIGFLHFQYSFIVKNRLYSDLWLPPAPRQGSHIDNLGFVDNMVAISIG